MGFLFLQRTEHRPASIDAALLNVMTLCEAPPLKLYRIAKSGVASIRNSLRGSQSNSLPAAHDARPALNALAAKS